VQGGLITISGAGLDTSQTDFTGMMARAIQVNAGIWAKDLKLVAGANQVNADQTSATAAAGTRAQCRPSASTWPNWAACTPARSRWSAPKPAWACATPAP
jgi:hypothetical protein